MGSVLLCGNIKTPEENVKDGCNLSPGKVLAQVEDIKWRGTGDLVKLEILAESSYSTD